MYLVDRDSKSCDSVPWVGGACKVLGELNAHLNIITPAWPYMSEGDAQDAPILSEPLFDIVTHSVSPGAGMVVDWEQETGLLMSSGDVRIVRIWDTDRETKVQVTTPGPKLRRTRLPTLPLHKIDLIPIKENQDLWLPGKHSRGLLPSCLSAGRQTGRWHLAARREANYLWMHKDCGTLTLHYSIIKPVLIQIISKYVFSVQIREYQKSVG